ncbi:MAG: tryptophan synthase subunit alpha [Methanomicrobiales archaeon]|nr:tryptophan synthase subunit alpha [Methanomicrobiales archaeon]
MNRLETMLAGRSAPAFIAFIVAGDPDRAKCVQIAKAVIDAGADILELGMPFSDPVADGPTIQRADERALQGGMNTDLLFDIIREIREYSEIPIVLLTYFNIVYKRGMDRFYHEASSAGLDAILIVDMPVEESEEASRLAYDVSIHQIFLVTPTTSAKRLELILSKAGGFLYLVSTLGVTGVRKKLSADALHLIERVKGRTHLPLAVGFGISTPDQVSQLIRGGADAIIVGSALVDIIEKHLHDWNTACSEIASYIKRMKQASGEYKQE